jgi:hypothetical protein
VCHQVSGGQPKQASRRAQHSLRPLLHLPVQATLLVSQIESSVLLVRSKPVAVQRQAASELQREADTCSSLQGASPCRRLMRSELFCRASATRQLGPFRLCGAHESRLPGAASATAPCCFERACKRLHEPSHPGSTREEAERLLPWRRCALALFNARASLCTRAASKRLTSSRRGAPFGRQWLPLCGESGNVTWAQRANRLGNRGACTAGRASGARRWRSGG